MIQLNNEVISSVINSDLEILSNHCNLFLPENRYIEFHKELSFYSNTLNYNIIYYIKEGGGWIESDDTKIPIKPNHYYLFPANLPKKYRLTYFPGTKKAMVKFMLSIFSYHDIFSDVNEVLCTKDTMNLTSQICQVITNHSASKQILLSSLIMLSLAPWLSEKETTIQEGLLRGKNYSSLFEYLDKNLYINLTLETVSKHTGLSVSSLTHNIPKKIGFTIKKYVQKNILKNVSFDLFYTEMRLKDIALKYGFSSEAYFSEWFYLQEGIRPKDFRKVMTSREYDLYASLK